MHFNDQSRKNLVFILCCRQFPVQLCFAMTINKYQRESLRYVGLDLQQPAFTHGQLYVALSHATSHATKVANLTVLLPESAGKKKDNVVYSEMLQHMQQTTSNIETSDDVDI